MRSLRAALVRLAGLFAGRRRDRDFAAEIDAHLQSHIDDNLQAGMTRGEAQRQAFLTFGGVAMTADSYHDRRSLPWFENIARDVRHAFHRLRRSPTFTIAAILSLALAIGANAAIFAVVQRVLLNPLPYPESDRLVALGNGMPSRNIPSGFNSLTSELYYQYLDRARTLASLAVHRTEEQTLTAPGSPERVQVSRTTPSLAAVLGITPAQGRWFTEEESAPGAAAVAVISHGLWVRRFGRDPAVLGQRLTLDGVPATIVGVMRPALAYPGARIEAWIPLSLTRATASPAYSFTGIARMRPGADVAAVRAELDRLGAELERSRPESGYSQLVSTASTLIEATVGRVSQALWILLASVGLVLLVACANVANLFLVRCESRQREVAVRRALGAGRLGIARYFLAESVLLSTAGGVVGLAIAWGAVRLLVAFGPANLPRLDEIRLDDMAVAFTFAVSVLAGLAFGAIPLLRGTSIAASLVEGGRANTASKDRHRARQLLMGGQVALALVLLVASGLMLRSFQKLRGVNPGFDAASALTFRIGLPRADYPDRGRIVAAHRAIVDRLSALPGVTAVAASTCLPLIEGCNQGNLVFVEGRTLPPGPNAPVVFRRGITGGYFETMGMRIVRGRGIERGDLDRNEPVAVLNQAASQALFPNQEAIGKRITLGNPARAANDPRWLTVVGVVSNTPTIALAEAAPAPQVFMPMFSSRDADLALRLNTASFVIRTAVSPPGVAEPARRAVGAIDSNLALAQVQTLQDVLDGAASQMAFTMVLLVIAAIVALLLGVIGIYGVMSYIVTQRTGEIGVRLALGARPASVVGMIVRQGGLVTLGGILIGLGAAFAGSRLIASLLFGVSPRDPAVFAATTITLLFVALLACWLPARRAASVDPLVALREQ